MQNVKRSMTFLILRSIWYMAPCCLFLLPGCTPLDVILYRYDGGPIPPEKSLAFGSLQLPPDRGAGIRLVNISTGKQVGTPTASPHDFCWHLPPGKYGIMRYYCGTPGNISNIKEWRVGAFFTVPESPSVTYIGALSIARYDKGIASTIKDEFDKDSAVFKERYPELTLPIKKEIMMLEEN